MKKIIVFIAVMAAAVCAFGEKYCTEDLSAAEKKDLAAAWRSSSETGLKMVVVEALTDDEVIDAHLKFHFKRALEMRRAARDVSSTNRTTTTVQIETVGTYGGLALYSLIDY